MTRCAICGKPAVRGAVVDAKEKRGQTALMWAAADGHSDVVELLHKAGADFRASLPDSGFTPLFFAAREGRMGVVRVLLKAGADVNEAMQPRRPPAKGPGKGTSALILAIENGHFELAVALLDSPLDLGEDLGAVDVGDVGGIGHGQGDGGIHLPPQWTKRRSAIRKSRFMA